jgi:predicted NBD/HSP70 family sugar kinase
VLTYLLSRQVTTRREISEHTGLSPAAVTKALQPMLRAGLVSESARPRVARLGAGRPTQEVRIVPARVTVAGIKITATRLIAVVTNLSGLIIDEFEVDIPGAGSVVDVDTVVGVIKVAVQELSVRHRLDRIGVAVSGDVDTGSGVVVLSPLLGWQNVPLASLLAAVINTPVIIDNDIRALTVAEQSFSDAFGIDDFALVTVGEGIGCGLVVGGHVLRGAFGVAGELGHTVVDVAGPAGELIEDDQPSGQGPAAVPGALERIVSRRAVVARARALGLASVAGYADLIAAADDGDRVSRDLLRRVGRELGTGIANVINLIGPRRLVISTEGFSLTGAFGEALNATIRARAFGQAAQVEIIHREIPFSEWARGAAVVALNEQVAIGAPADEPG